FLLASLALLLALAIVEVSLPFFESIVNESLAVSHADPLTWVALLALLAVVGLMSGLYPAFVLSHFRPAGALRTTQSAETKGSSSVRRVLVTVQFGVSIALMIATIAIYAQVQFVLSRDPGFNAENLLLVENLLNVDSPWSSGGSGARKETLRREVASLPDVSSVGLSMHRPTQAVGLSTIIMPFTLQGGPGAAQQIAVVGIDDGFFETYRIPVISG